MRKLGQAELDKRERHAEDADRLAEQHAEVHAERDRVGDERPHVDAHEAHLRVDEGENRQDHEVHRRRDEALHAHERRRHAMHHALDLGGGVREVMLSQDVGLVVIAVVELGQALTEPFREVVELDAALGGDGEGKDHAGERRVHTALEHAEPQQQAQEHIGCQAVVLRLVERDERDRHECGGAEPEQAGALAVEDGDGGDGDEVVGDGERREEDAHPVGHAVAEQRQHAQGERDVRRHGDSPAVGGAAVIEDQVDAGGNDHATHGREHRQHRLARVLELTDRHLVLELDAHEQEEDRHEKVVDEELDREPGRPGTEPQVEWLFQKVMDRLVGGRVGADHGRDGGEHHDGCRNRSVLGDALPQVVALEAFALALVEQLLAGIHGRLLSRGRARLEKARAHI